MNGETVAAPAAAPAAAAPPVTEAAAARKPLAIAPAEVEPSEEYEIDGKKMLLTRTQARTYIQKAGAVDKRMEETTRLQNRLDALLKDFETDPEAALKKVGKDPEKIIAGLLAKKAKLELMSPEQQALVKAQEDRDALQARLDKLESDKKTEDQQRLDQRNEEALRNQMIAVADKYNLDGTPETLEGLCQVALELLEYGTAPTLDQIAQEFQRQELEHLKSRDKKIVGRLKGDALKSFLKDYAPKLLVLPPAELLEILGPAGIRAVQAATLSRVPAVAKKPLPVAPVTPAPTRVIPARNDAGKFVSEAEFDRKFRR